MTAARLTTFRVAERRLTELWVMARANDMVVALGWLYIYVLVCVVEGYSFDGMIRMKMKEERGFEWRNDLEVSFEV
jgi:hypothetical protein